MPYKAIKTEAVAARPSALLKSLTRRQLEVLDDLRRLIAAEGFRHLRMADFATRLGCSPSLLYRIAKSRDELVYMTIESWHERFENDMRGLDQEKSSLELLKDSAMILANTHEPLSHQTIEDIRVTPAARHVVEEFKRRNLRRTERVIERGVASGEIAGGDPRFLANVWYNAVDSASNRMFESKKGLSRVELIEQAAELVSRGLRA